jgi:hypothetical protein
VANETTNSKPTPGDGNVNDLFWCNAAGLVFRPLSSSRDATRLKWKTTRRRRKSNKGCGIGYALATDSCEGVGSVDARTVAAP